MPSRIAQAMARSRSPVLADLAVELVRGDISHGPELAEALRDCDAVYHLAGVVSRDPDDSQRMMRVHVDGTRRLYELGAEAGVRRVVVASSSGTIAVSDYDTIHDEESGFATETVAGWP